MLPEKIAFVDIETTGLRLKFDRVIEIGIIRIVNNKLINTYHTLINPQEYLRPDIQNITGISREELENAPTFRQVKDEILEMLQDCVFASHNVRFDYGFLKNELKRLNVSFSPQHFCTIKLSQYLYPSYKHHNLDSLIERFKIICKRRHRAFDDAKVLWEFFQMINKNFSKETLDNAFSAIMKRPSLPIKLPFRELDKLPQSFGVYIFYGSSGVPLYIGKSINIRQRILSHFSRDHASSIEMKISQQIESIKTITTCGELGALFKEAQLIKQLLPLYNRKLRIRKNLVVLKSKDNLNRYKTVSLEIVENINDIDIETIYGVYKSVKQAKNFLTYISDKYSLCKKILNLENTTTACFSYRLGRCNGACLGEENPLAYNSRFIMAFSQAKIKKWPFSGPILIEESNSPEDKKETFFIDKWCVIGSIITDELEVEKFIEYSSKFDVDHYEILKRYIKSAKNKNKIKQITKRKLSEYLNYSSNSL